ncbi:hypothetical protein [Sphingosinicella sp.]|uniref:hypothetical protein n=1 Tax=Sphingosinicella sp. TaxID=1917971 RepID=UPI0040383CDB
MLSDREMLALGNAIERQVLTSVAYNRGRSILAPLQLFSEGGEAFLKAVTVARDGVEPKRLKLGKFKLVALSDLHLVGSEFSAAALLRRIEAIEAARARAGYRSRANLTTVASA